MAEKKNNGQNRAGRKKTTKSSVKRSAVKGSEKKSSVLPQGVVDGDAYAEYLKIKNSDVMKNCEVETSDPNTTINLKATTYIMDKKMAHLPEDEQDKLRAQATVLRKLNGKMTSLKRKAFNIKQNGPYSMQESILDGKASELLEYFGRFYSAAEVHQIVTTEWGLDVNFSTIDNFRKRNIDRIKEKQEAYKRDYSDIRLGHKRSRLDELQYLYTHRKAKYESTSSKEDYKLLLQTIEQIRKEVEGDKLTIDGHLSMDVEHTVNIHIQQEVLKTVVINDIIIGRLAARVGVDSRMLINKLHNSYYSKFTGFQRPDNNLLEDQPIYPSKFVYNFDDLDKQSKQLEEKEKQFEQSLPKLTEGEKEHASDIKQVLIEKIRQKQEQINESKNRLNKE